MNGFRRIALPPLLMALGLAGCIDASQRMATCPTSPTDTARALNVCSGATRPADDGLIDDFEDGDNQVGKIGGRDGYWFTSHDDKGSTIGPNPLKMADGAATGSPKALRVTGQTANENGAWGSLVGMNFVAQGPYDASKYGGISFKGKVDKNSTKKVRFKVGDVDTHPDGGVCKECWNHFGKDISLTTEWQEYKVTFAEMKQEAGWGDRYPAITPSKLVSINWSIGVGQAFDLWIDDLQFFECL